LLSAGQATQLFKEFSHDVTFVDDHQQQRPLAFDYPDDGCFLRAQQMDEYAWKTYGLLGGKQFVVGTDAGGNAMLDVPSDYAPDASGSPQVKWVYHVAPVFAVQQPDGSTQMMVFDPSMFDKPVSVRRRSTRSSRPGKPARRPQRPMRRSPPIRQKKPILLTRARPARCSRRFAKP
jgi:hypothetical protein